MFGGQKGPEISRNLAEIESTFNRHLMDLRRVKNSILDVKATTWHEDYNKFRSAVKEMEVMIINVINAAFDTVTYVEQGVEILDAFMHLSAREVRSLLMARFSRSGRVSGLNVFGPGFAPSLVHSPHHRQKDGRHLPAVHGGTQLGEAGHHVASCHH